jgi:hypothetical protein
VSDSHSHGDAHGEPTHAAPSPHARDHVPPYVAVFALAIAGAISLVGVIRMRALERERDAETATASAASVSAATSESGSANVERASPSASTSASASEPSR